MVEVREVGRMTGRRQISRFWIREYRELIWVVVVGAILLRLFVLSAHRVSTTALTPELLPGDHVFAYQLAYGLLIPGTKVVLAGKIPQRGDVVVARWADREAGDSVQRVVGLPGDRVEIRDGQLLVNEAQVRFKSDINWGEPVGPLIVDPGHLYLLGAGGASPPDDSRQWGPIRLADIRGKIVMIWLSVDEGVRWDRFFKRVHALDH